MGVHGLLRVTTSERLTVEQAVQHRWFSMESTLVASSASGAPAKDSSRGQTAMDDGQPVKRQKTMESAPPQKPYATPSSASSAPLPPPYATQAPHFGVSSGTRPISAK